MMEITALENQQQQQQQQDKRSQKAIFTDLLHWVEEADTIVVNNSSSKEATSPPVVLFESKLKSDVKALRDVLVVCLSPPTFWSHCPCIGNPLISLYKEGKEILQLSNHHSKSIRCSLYENDIPLVKQETWLAWFDERGIPNPRDEADRITARKQKEDKEYHKFMSVMPRYLKAAWKRNQEMIHFDGKCPDDLNHALHNHLCGKTTKGKIIDLLIWYANTGSECPGCRIYERVAESLLLTFEPHDIAEAVLSHNNSQPRKDTRLMQGATKLLTGFRFQKKYSNCIMMPGERWKELEVDSDIPRFDSLTLHNQEEPADSATVVQQVSAAS